MPPPTTVCAFLDVVEKSGQVEIDRVTTFLAERRQHGATPQGPEALAALLVSEGLLTLFQAEQFLRGKHRGFDLGGYRVLERLGAGGAGTVYLAEHQLMRRMVAVKVLPPALARVPGAVARFHREAQAVAALNHPNIVKAYDFRKEGELYLLVMEYVCGASLQDVIAHQGRLEVGLACEYVRQAAVGLQYAHDNGMVHRDVKPANLLVDQAGTVKVLDLGLALVGLGEQEAITRKFEANSVVGTMDYIAPEQALNLHEVDGRADVYSLGATLYTLLTGEPPFAGVGVTQKLLAHQVYTPRPLREVRPDVPQAVADLVARMMVKKPDRRLPSCAAVAEALAPYCTDALPQEPILPSAARAFSPSSSSRLKPAPSTRRRVAAATEPEIIPTVEVAEEPVVVRRKARRRRKRQTVGLLPWLVLMALLTLAGGTVLLLVLCA